MRCTECPHFRIAYNPIRCNGELLDTGLAKCEKNDLVVDFLSERKLNRLTCVDEEREECQKKKGS